MLGPSPEDAPLVALARTFRVARALSSYHVPLLFPGGVHVLRAFIYEFCGTEKELGPYFVEVGPATVSVFMNSSSIHKDELLLFAGPGVGQEGKRHTWSRAPRPAWAGAVPSGSS